jgi:hypothetical protein
LEKDLPLLPSSQAKKGNLDGRTNHNLSDPYIWHRLLIPIHRGPSSPHIWLLSPHVWYGYLKIEKCYIVCFPRLLLPSWLMYPNNSFKASTFWNWVNL